MEDGYFQSQLPEGLEPKDEPQIQVPIPSELPERLNLSQLPENVMKSGAIESLIQQNDDLMARLSVNLRRISSLEEEVSDLNKSNTQYRKRYENLKDQVLILKERGKTLNQRSQGRDDEFNRIKNELKLVEIRYAELYTNTQERQSSLLGKIEILSKRIQRFVKYRRSMSNAAKGLRKLNQHLELENKKMFEAILGLETKNKNLQSTIEETTEYIRKQGREAKDHQESLVAKYEISLGELRTEVSTAREEIQHLKASATEASDSLAKKQAEIDSLYNQKTELENQIVVIERRQEESRIRKAAEFSDLQQSLTRYRNEAKAQAFENERLTEEINETREKLEESLEAQGNAQEQVENLQVLWKDNQARIEKQTEKVQSLQRLNQQLSINMNQYRKELKEIKEHMDTTQLRTTEKVREIKSQVETVNGLKGNSAEPSAMPEVVDKIDRLLAEIHSGFRMEESSDSPSS